MTDACDPDGRPAGELLELSLERHRDQGRRRLRLAAWTLASAATLGFVGTPSIGEWVVRRRSDGAEVLRLDAGAEEEAAMLRRDLDDQLDRLSAAEFLRRWGVG